MLRTIIVAHVIISTVVTAGSKKKLFDESLNNELDRPMLVVSEQGVAGQKGTLPCDVQPRDATDAVSMVLWFKEAEGEPLYSYDARSRSSKPKLWSARDYWGDRATFVAAAPARLVIQDLQESDQGVYRCRVDFHNSPTRNMRVNFSVIVPPSKPIIYDAKRRDMSKLLEAYAEGSDLALVCEVHGGRPRPSVSWYLDSQLIDDSYEVVDTQRVEAGETSFLAINRVTLERLDRKHHHAKLACKATNTALAPPPTTTVSIELNMRPLKVEIVNKEKIVTAGKKYEVQCRSNGSKPAASLSWWRGSKQLIETAKVFQNGSFTVSTLEWTPKVDDEGKHLVCRAENPRLSEAGIEDRWRLEVHFAPIVSLKMGSSLNPDDIKEGDDIHFECNVRANPRAHKLSWTHEFRNECDVIPDHASKTCLTLYEHLKARVISDTSVTWTLMVSNEWAPFQQGVEIRSNVSGGVVKSDHSLVLQSITRKSAGKYTCLATNTIGKQPSNVVNLNVMFAPICKHVLNSGPTKFQNATPPPLNLPQELHGAVKRENVLLACEVEASPTSVTFHWTFNSSGDLNEIPQSRYTSDGTVSKLNYTPTSDTDYGTFGCWARNIIGHSKQPCLYQLIAAGRPYPLQNCTALNLIGVLIRIVCIEGFDGGLPQKFVAMSASQRWESAKPYWELNLEKPTNTVELYAVNAKGSSDPVVMDNIALKGVAKFTGDSVSSVNMSPILIGLGGTATGLGLIVTGVLIALWRRHAATPAKPKPPQPTIATFAGKGDEEDGNPDLIPTNELANHLDRKLPAYASLPRRPHHLEGREISYDLIEDPEYPQAIPNMYYSLQRPHNRYVDTITPGNTTSIQESSI